VPFVTAVAPVVATIPAFSIAYGMWRPPTNPFLKTLPRPETSAANKPVAARFLISIIELSSRPPSWTPRREQEQERAPSLAVLAAASAARLLAASSREKYPDHNCESPGQAKELVLWVGDRQTTTNDNRILWPDGTLILPDAPESLDATTVVEAEAEAKAEAERPRSSLTMFTDGSRLENGAAGCAVCWQRGSRWVGIKSHMGYNQEAYDAECAALARALEVAALHQTPPEGVAIFTDAQAAIRRMATDEPCPGQRYVIEARKHITTLRKAKPGVRIEIRWCPSHRDVPGNEKADEWAELAADEPNAHGVEWLTYVDGRGARAMPLPRSLAHLKRKSSEKKWAEARQWAEAKISAAKYKPSNRQRPDMTVASSSKMGASRYYQLKTGHALIGQYLKWIKSRPTAECGSPALWLGNRGSPGCSGHPRIGPGS